MYSCFNTRQVNINGPIMTFVVKRQVESEGTEKEIRQFEVLYETTQVESTLNAEFWDLMVSLLFFLNVAEIRSKLMLMDTIAVFQDRGEFERSMNALFIVIIPSIIKGALKP
ncbi:hypothetical protein HAX54_020351 [Datura stramonium]|uniref:Uncharacterized protein n=1 Tax=Datura stramonium TaxID=4076 RepID=A0ABS8S2V6_DATST|nr:hypothetical protein [Datura stramonium]